MICGNDTVRKQGYPEIDSINLTGRETPREIVSESKAV
jgi:hypothetical protein